MKKKLRNILVLSLGLMTTIASAQDWNVDSRTRANMHGEDGMMLTEQRATVGATWGGTDWGIHVSSDVNYALGQWDAGNTAPGVLTAKVYEAYASTDLMGYASLTVGRQALDYGSGAIMGSNQFAGIGAQRNTQDGMLFGLNLDMADVTVGYANVNYGLGDSLETKGTNMFINLNKAEGDWSANLLYATGTSAVGGVENDDATAMGLDLAYAMMDGALGLNVSYNTNSGEKDVVDGTTLLKEDMMSLGATYQVNESMSITANQTTYGENGFDLTNTNMSGNFLTHGNMGYLRADDKDMNVGVSYAMGDFTLGATMHQITNDGEDVLGSTTNADYERNVTNLSLAYTMTDNANLSLQYASDELGDADADKYMWVTLNIRP